MREYDYIVIGGGIIGLSVANEILEQEPYSKLLLIEKEADVGFAQTGNNSGVLHSGIYYNPRSLKSKLCVQGKRLWEEYCKTHKLPIENTGKLIVATQVGELKELERLRNNARSINLSIEYWDSKKIKEVGGKGKHGIYIPSTKSIDFRLALHSLKTEIIKKGAQILFREEVDRLEKNLIRTKSGLHFTANNVVVSTGINVDTLAPSKNYFMFGFTGVYFKSKKLRNSNVLIYPAPNPTLPFLGIHTCKGDKKIEYFGPSAVPSFRNTPISFSGGPYFLRLGWYRVLFKYWKFGLKEILTWLFTSSFKRQVKKVVNYKIKKLIRGFSGTRAQCISSKGDLVDDFIIEKNGEILILRNVPSPAATSSLAIAKHIYSKYYAQEN
jgi:L-2-hydroxyglutarate oxidase